MSSRKIFTNAIIFIALIAITFYILLKDSNIHEIIKTVQSVNVVWLIPAVLCVFFSICSEGINIRRMLKLFSYDVKFFSALKYAFVGFFFSSITPSASGGQPMQIYSMNKDRIQVSHGSLSILMELASFQIVTVTIATIAFILNYSSIQSLNPGFKVLVYFGISFNALILCFILLAIFSKNIARKATNLALRLFKKFHYKKIEKLQKSTDEQLEKYREGSKIIKANKIIMLKILLTTTIQILCMYSVSYFVYRSFGLSRFSLLTVLSMQALVSIAVSSIPIPGAVGVSESCFLDFFKTLFPVNLLSSAMLLTRGVSFYLFVLISGIVVSVSQFSKNKH